MRKNLLYSLLFLLSSCTSKHQNAATETLSHTEKLRYEQYMIQGRELYTSHCSNCHQEDGIGLGHLIPPLAQSDYLLSNREKSLCIIKYGLSEKIIVNGIEYQQPMPENTSLSDIEIAQIATYIYNSWGNEAGYMPVKEVSPILEDCR